MMSTGMNYFSRFKVNKYKGFIIMLLVLVFFAGCATQHKYKKIKAVPCPCEKVNKR